MVSASAIAAASIVEMYGRGVGSSMGETRVAHVADCIQLRASAAELTLGKCNGTGEVQLPNDWHWKSATGNGEVRVWGLGFGFWVSV